MVLLVDSEDRNMKTNSKPCNLRSCSIPGFRLQDYRRMCSRGLLTPYPSQLLLKRHKAVLAQSIWIFLKCIKHHIFVPVYPPVSSHSRNKFFDTNWSPMLALTLIITFLKTFIHHEFIIIARIVKYELQTSCSGPCKKMYQRWTVADCYKMLLHPVNCWTFNNLHFSIYTQSFWLV